MGAESILLNQVICPKCNEPFFHNKINGVALIELAQTIETKKRMHCRLTLDALERLDLDEPAFKAIKKVVLDGYNDLARDIHTILGFGVDAE